MSPMRTPAVAVTAGGFLLAIETDRDRVTSTEVVDADGNLIFAVTGRRPKVAAGPDGNVLVIVERPGKERVDLVGYVLRDGQAGAELRLPAAGDFNVNASVAWHPQARVFCVAWESCPCWGLDERVGLHRDLSVWSLVPGSSEVRPAPGTCGGFVRIRPEAFFSGSAQNLTPIQPRVFPIGDSLGLAFRRFRFTGVYPYGWDTFLMHSADDGWTEPGRVSPSFGHADVDYAIVPQQNGLVGFFPSCDYRPWQTFEEEAAGVPGTRKDMRVRNQRLEIVRFGLDDALPTEMPYAKRTAYVIPLSIHEAAPEPPALSVQPEGRTLIWGDLHAHCAYSKCMGCNDGLPQDVLRYQRDVLGCHVLCLTDHVEYMSAAEFAHVMDCIEREADEAHIPLYGVEWARFPAHHTNFFGADREVFDRLRTLMFAHHHLTPLYDAIKKELPEGSVVAIRHMHGEDHDEFGVSGARTAETHDPEVEWAMEGMQTRGNMMIAPPGRISPFPHKFLDAGCEIGIVGGSDHSRGRGTNSFCLTGFWVRDRSAAGALEAIRSRKTFGVASGKIALHTTLNGVPMGERVSASRPVRIEAHASSARSIRRVCLMRDGELLPWLEVGAKVTSLELVDEEVAVGRHWYCVTVEGAEAYPKSLPVAHSSPFFVDVV